MTSMINNKKEFLSKYWSIYMIEYYIASQNIVLNIWLLSNILKIYVLSLAIYLSSHSFMKCFLLFWYTPILGVQLCARLCSCPLEDYYLAIELNNESNNLNVILCVYVLI